MCSKVTHRTLNSWLYYLVIHISQGSVAICLKRGGIFKHEFVANLLLSRLLKNFWKSDNSSVKLWPRVWCHVFFDSQCSLVLSIWFSPLLCLSLFLHTRHALCSPRWSLTVLPCFVTTGLFTMHLLYYSFIVFLASAFFALIYNVLFQPLSPNNSWLTTLYCQPIVLLHQPYHFCCLLVYSLTLPSFPQSFSSFVCSSLR